MNTATPARPPPADDGWSGAWRRFRNWWQGSSTSGERRSSGPPPPPLAAALPEQVEPPSGWTPARIAVAERLFGPGLIAPSSDAYIKSLIRPLRLDRTRTVVEIGAGLGGNAEVIARETGAQVIGLEANPVLAKAGAERTAASGVSASVRGFAPPAIDLPAGSADAVYARQTFFAIADKAALYGSIHGLLRSGGALLFTDLMLANEGSAGPRLETWRSDENASPWTLKRTIECLDGLGFEIRVTVEVTDDLRVLILGAWANFARDTSGSFDYATGAAVIAEGELWQRRLALLGAGELVAYRVLAMKKDA